MSRPLSCSCKSSSMGTFPSGLVLNAAQTLGRPVPAPWAPSVQPRAHRLCLSWWRSLMEVATTGVGLHQNRRWTHLQSTQCRKTWAEHRGCAQGLGCDHQCCHIPRRGERMGVTPRGCTPAPQRCGQIPPQVMGSGVDAVPVARVGAGTGWHEGMFVGLLCSLRCLVGSVPQFPSPASQRAPGSCSSREG